MGRAFEYRKNRKMKRWSHMSKVFTRIGKEITMVAKQGGGSPDANPRLRLLIQQARAENMPKENVERAIKRATEKDAADYKEMVYEGYGPHGIAIVIDTATDNSTRTVANIRSIFNKGGGSLGTTGSLDFLFERKCVFKISAEGKNLEELEFELIDYGAEELFSDDEFIFIYGDFKEFGNIQRGLEERNIEVLSAEFERIPFETKELTPEQEEDIMKMIEKFEEDDDVQRVFHNMKESAEAE